MPRRAANLARKEIDILNDKPGLQHAPALVPEPGIIEALLELLDEPVDESIETQPERPTSSVPELALS